MPRTSPCLERSRASSATDAVHERTSTMLSDGFVHTSGDRNLYLALVRGCCCCCCCCCSHINSHNQVRGVMTGSSHSGAEEYPREKTGSSHSGAEEYPREKTQTKGGIRICHSWRNSCLRQEHIKSAIGSQPTKCLVVVVVVVVVVSR